MLFALASAGCASETGDKFIDLAGLAEQRSEVARLSSNYVQCMTDLRYTLTGKDGRTRRVSRMRGNVRPGDAIQATFTLIDRQGCGDLEVRLLSYTAPEPFWNPATAHLQRLVRSEGGVLPPGRHSLSLTAPECFFQVDLVYGAPIEVFAPPAVTFSAQGRLIDADNDGSAACECHPGAASACYTGREGTSGVGQCQPGTALCDESGLTEGPCDGQVLPTDEVCDGVDSDCNGIVDDAPECAGPVACEPAGSQSVCGANAVCDVSLAADGLVCRDITADKRVGEVCETLSECAEGHTCSGTRNGFLCRAFCSVDADCQGPGARCSAYLYGARTCSVSCNPADNSGCPAGFGCDPTRREDGADITLCLARAPVTQPEGGVCSDSSECAVEAACVVPATGPRVCRTLCDRRGADICAAGSSCVSFREPYLWGTDVEVGYCQPK